MCPSYIFEDFVLVGPDLATQTITEHRYWDISDKASENYVVRALCIRVNRITGLLHRWDMLVRDHTPLTDHMYENLLSLLDAHLPLAITATALEQEGRLDELTFSYVLEHNLSPEDQHEETLPICRQNALPRLGEIIMAAWITSPPHNVNHITRYNVMGSVLELCADFIGFLISKCGMRKCQMKNIHEKYISAAKSDSNFRLFLHAIVSCIMSGSYVRLKKNYEAQNIHSFHTRIKIAMMTPADSLEFIKMRDKDFTLCIMRMYLCMHLSPWSALYQAMSCLYDVDALIEHTHRAVSDMFCENETTHELEYKGRPSVVSKRSSIYSVPYSSFWDMICRSVRIPTTAEETKARKEWTERRKKLNEKTGGRMRRSVKEMESSSGVPVSILHIPNNFDQKDLAKVGISSEAGWILRMMHYWRYREDVYRLCDTALIRLKDVTTTQELYRIRLLAEEMDRRNQIKMIEIDPCVLHEDTSMYTHLKETSASVAHQFPQAMIGVCLNCAVVSMVPVGHTKKHAAAINEFTKVKNTLRKTREKKSIQTTDRISMHINPFTQECKMVCMGCDMREICMLDITGYILYAKVHVQDVEPCMISACMDCGIICVLRSDSWTGLLPVCKKCNELRVAAAEMKNFCYYDGHYLCQDEIRCSFTALSPDGKVTKYVSCWMHDPGIDEQSMSPLTSVESIRLYRRYGGLN